MAERALLRCSVALLANVHSCEVVVAVSRCLEVAFLSIVSQCKPCAQSISHLGLAAEDFWCWVSTDREPYGLKGREAQYLSM